MDNAQNMEKAQLPILEVTRPREDHFPESHRYTAEKKVEGTANRGPISHPHGEPGGQGYCGRHHTQRGGGQHTPQKRPRVDAVDRLCD